MVEELPLKTLWESLGATFEIEGNWRLPAYFKTIQVDYKNAQTAGLIDFSHRGKIEVTGADRVAFLNNILTNDIKNLKNGQSCPAALLSAPGKVLALMKVRAFEDRLVLDMDPGLDDKLMTLLDKYLITEEVTLTRKTLVHLALTGKNAANIAKSFNTFEENENRFDFWIGKENLRMVPEILKAGKDLGISPVGNRVAEILRIEAGELRYGLDADETVSLNETGLDQTFASETKGCYPGQEVVARTNTYKGLQKKMTGFLLEGDVLPSAGDKIHAEDGKEIGWITGSCVSPGALRGLALGYLIKGYFDREIQVSIRSHDHMTIKASTKPGPDFFKTPHAG